MPTQPHNKRGAEEKQNIRRRMAPTNRRTPNRASFANKKRARKSQTENPHVQEIKAASQLETTVHEDKDKAASSPRKRKSEQLVTEERQKSPEGPF